MEFEIRGKVALITGGASGIGFCAVKELLKHGIKGIAIVDVDEELANKALIMDIKTENVIFLKADISNKEQFSEAFKKTVEVFGCLDIVFNNAGILDDANWELEVDVNIKGTANGILLGQQYLQKYKQDHEGVIVNCGSNAGVNVMECVPMYSATKFAVTAMTQAFGHQTHYERTKIRVVALCPGTTDTPLISKMPGHFLGDEYQNMIDCNRRGQSPEFVTEALIKVIKNSKSGTIWMVEDGIGPYQFIQPDRKTFIPKCQ